MANFESGVREYITGTATVKVYFPVDMRGNADINCFQCNYFSHSSHVCQLNKEIPEYPSKYVGSKCPLKMTKEE